MTKRKDFPAYLQFARQISTRMIGTAQDKADLLERSCRAFGLKGTRGQVKKADGRILLVSNDQKKCFQISIDGEVQYAGWSVTLQEAIDPQPIRFASS